MIASQRVLIKAAPAASCAPAANILIVVRDPDEQRRLTAYLTGIFATSSTPNTHDIYRLLHLRPVQAIIIDMGSFPGEATRLCAQLKDSPDTGHIPVILLFSPASSRLRIQCLEAGADALLEKPFSQTHLLAQIRNLDRNRTRIQQHLTNSHPEPADSTFSKNLDHFIYDNLSNPGLNVDLLARLMNMSRPTFYRKMKDLSNASPNELINAARLEKAADLIANTNQTIAEIAAMVGFHSRSNFGKAFFRQFHTSPTVFRRLQKTQIPD